MVHLDGIWQERIESPSPKSLHERARDSFQGSTKFKVIDCRTFRALVSSLRNICSFRLLTRIMWKPIAVIQFRYKQWNLNVLLLLFFVAFSSSNSYVAHNMLLNEFPRFLVWLALIC